jgi:hypothetical protein
MNQRAAGIVADPTDHGSTDARGTDDRMRLPAQRLQFPFQRVERGSRQANDLATSIDQVDRIDSKGIHQDDRPVVGPKRRRAASQPGVSGLKDHDGTRIQASLQHPPLLDQRAWPHHRHDLSVAVAVASGVAFGCSGVGEHMGWADDFRQRPDELFPRRRSCGAACGCCDALHLRPSITRPRSCARGQMRTGSRSSNRPGP